MSIAALITGGIGPGGSVPLLLTGGLGIGDAPADIWTPVTPAASVWTPIFGTLVWGQVGAGRWGSMAGVKWGVQATWTPRSAANDVWARLN